MTKSAKICCYLLVHLHATFLEQTLHKFPVGLGDDGRGQIRQFGLSQVLPQAAGLLHVLLKTRQSHLENNKIILHQSMEVVITFVPVVFNLHTSKRLRKTIVPASICCQIT